MGPLRHIRPAWWVLLIIFLAHQILQKGLGYDIPVVHAYLDPLLSIPIMLGLWLIERRWVFGITRLTGLETILGTLFFALIFEGLFPWLSTDFTRDWLDLLAYALGGLLFWLFVNGNEAASVDARDASLRRGNSRRV